MKNLRKKRRNPAYDRSAVRVSKKEELKKSVPAIESFVERYFKSINGKNHLNDSWDKDAFDYPCAIIDLTCGTYMIGFDTDKQKFFSMFEKYTPESRYEPSDSEFVDIGPDFDNLSEACSFAAQHNVKEEIANMANNLDYTYETFIQEEFETEDY